MITGGSTLDPGFPTWGTMLREHGYRTRWYGKWHLTHGDGHWNGSTRPPALAALRLRRRHLPLAQRRARARAGAWTGASPSQFADVVRRTRAARGPWCTTVSFVNPHDIAWW